jgi:hypothetical protein
VGVLSFILNKNHEIATHLNSFRIHLVDITPALLPNFEKMALCNAIWGECFGEN